MSTIRQLNLLGQQRIDVPHLRSLESSIAADFDLLGGRIMAGNTGLVVRGFTIPDPTAAVGQLASTLTLRVTDGVLVHPQASESGSIFFVPSDTADESLSSVNTKVYGSFTASVTNYIGLDLSRKASSSTADLVKFYDPDSEGEIPKVVPLARVLDYRIVVTAIDFSLQPNVLPIAKVVTDSTNKVVSIVDARPMMFRLGSGGNNPDRLNTYYWQSRLENTTEDIFAGGDKQIDSLKAWMDAAMTRIWEIGGGQYWYSPCSDRDVKLLMTGTPMANNEYFTWDSGDKKLTWQGLALVFGNSEQATYNEIADEATGVPFPADYCLYVDIDRSANRTRNGDDALVAEVAPLSGLGSGTIPGSRWVIAWRKGNEIFVRDSMFKVGSVLTPATTTGRGVVVLNADAYDNGGSDTDPKVAIVDGAGKVVGGGLTNDAGLASPGPVVIGDGANDNAVNIGQAGIDTTVYGTLKTHDGAEANQVARSCKVDVYSAAGTHTWTKPTNAKVVKVICIGGGGGGGSGRLGATSSYRGGGGGGGGGCVSVGEFNASVIGDTVTVTVGAGGAGGASKLTTASDGSNGTDGGYSGFGTWLTVGGGGGGVGGTTSAVSGGGGGGSYGSAMGYVAGIPAADSDGIGGQGAKGDTLSARSAEWGGASGGPSAGLASTGEGGCAIFGASGGGGGGTYLADNTPYGGKAGGKRGWGTGGGGSGSSTGNGAAGSNNSTAARGYCGTGGGGGCMGDSVNRVGGDGGAGGAPGAGGGGGGGGTTGGTFPKSGAGGKGGDGEVRVYTFF